MQRDYSPKGVKFYYVYKSLAHPENDGFVQPVTLDERLMHIQEAKRRLGTQFTWICDSMANDLKHALGNRPNSEFIIAPDGTIARMRDWSNPAQLRRDLVELVGEVARPTNPADLNMQTDRSRVEVARGVVERVQLPGRLRPVTVQAKTHGTPAYVKLRAEVSDALLRSGKGQVYLGLFVDPIHHVHWNNMSDPV